MYGGNYTKYFVFANWGGFLGEGGSGLAPVGGCNPDRNDPPPPNICRAFKFGKASPQSIFQTVFCHLFLCFRGGGSFRSGVQPPTGSVADRHSPTRTPRPAFHKRHSIFPDLELQTDIRQGWSVPALCRSGVAPPTGIDRPGLRQKCSLNFTPCDRILFLAFPMNHT